MSCTIVEQAVYNSRTSNINNSFFIFNNINRIFCPKFSKQTLLNVFYHKEKNFFIQNKIFKIFKCFYNIYIKNENLFENFI